MGIKQRNRVHNEPTPTIPPQPIDVADENYRGLDPDDIDYPLTETVSDSSGKRSLELRAFTKKGMGQLRRIAEEQLFPTLDALKLNLAVLCEKRRDSGTGRVVMGVCFNAGRQAQEAGERQKIMLRQPDADSPRVAAVLLHELAHCLEANHLPEKFGRLNGRYIAHAVSDGTPFTKWRRELIALAKGDSYRPIPPSGSWDDYASLPSAPSPIVEPVSAFKVDASYGVADWGFSADLIPKNRPEALDVEMDTQELVDHYLRIAPSVVDDIGNGGFEWDTDSMGIALAELYDIKLRERGVAQRRINKLRQTMDWGWGVKQNIDTIEPILDAEVRKRRADAAAEVE